MSEEKPFNLFSGAAHKSPKPSKHTPKAVPSPIVDSFAEKHVGFTLPAIPPNLPLSDELKEMISRMKHLHDEIDKKLDEIYQRSGLSPKQIKKYLENPNNFKNQEWERIQRERKRLLNSIWQKLGRKEIDIEKIEQQQNLQQTSKERKGKTLGARRNWISMH